MSDCPRDNRKTAHRRLKLTPADIVEITISSDNRDVDVHVRFNPDVVSAVLIRKKVPPAIDSPSPDC